MKKPVILELGINMCNNLNSEEQHHFLKLLQKYEHLFDGILGEFNMEPASLHLIDK
jgi:hypothetical protein